MNPSAFEQPRVSAIFSKLKEINVSKRLNEDARLTTLLEVAVSLVPQQNIATFSSFLRSCSSMGISLPVACLPALWTSSEGLLSRARASELTTILDALCRMHIRPSGAWFAAFWKAFESSLPDCRADTLSVALRACVALNAAPPGNLLADWTKTSKFKGDPVDELSSSNVLYACALFSQWPSSTAIVPIWSGLREKHFVMFSKFQHAYLLAAVERPGILPRQDPRAVIQAAQYVRRSRFSLSPDQPVTPLEIEVASLLARHGFAFEQRTWCNASACHIALTLPAHRIAIEVNESADFNLSKDDESSQPEHTLNGTACMRRRLLERCGKWRVVSVSSVEWAPATDEWDDERPARARQALLDAIRELGAKTSASGIASANAKPAVLPRAATKEL
jgi:hypothetical protein